MALVYLNDFIEFADELAELYKKGFAAIRSDDEKYRKHLDQADKRQRSFFRTAQTLSIDSQQQLAKAVLKEYAAAKRICQEKQAIASSMVGTMDKVLKHMDEKLLEFEQELEVVNPGSTSKLKEQSLELDKEDAVYGPPKSMRGYSARTTTPQVAKKRKTAETAQEEAAEDAEDKAKYCLCRKGSYGAMIACDNQKCPIEWFHLDCVGLAEAPEGTWYCPLCRNAMGTATSTAVH
eukprot:m.57511 g.57511  ORF g.57511 m.57511 type:complete len:235 (-) comp13092_c0_seq2:164-868(-)